MDIFKTKIGESELTIEVGKMAKQANGSVLARYAGSSVLATACCSSDPIEGLDYIPLSVDYNERYYAAGKIPGGFLKREARPKDKEILVSRLIDRPMRPLFYKEFGREIHVVPMTVSADQINPPDVVGMMAAFAAVQISDIPFNGPVAAVRVALVNGEFLINPTFEQLESAELDIIVAGSKEGICMVEGGSKEVSEETMLDAIAVAEQSLTGLCDFLEEIAKKCGKKKLPMAPPQETLAEADEVQKKAIPLLEKALFVEGKDSRKQAVKEAKKELKEGLGELDEEREKQFSTLFESVEKEVLRASIINNNRRCDGRGSKEIRQIECEVGILQRTHGSALFTRGETQSLGVATLGSVLDEQIMDNIDGDKRQNFMLHYNFPPYSVGETGRLATGRREIGHGHLAQRAMEAVLPEKEKYPFTTRVVSEVLESNGSSSMATVCSSTLCLFDAGVPLKNSVAGIAMGLVKEGEKFAVLSDILGEEDHMGDMDFKVAGTKEGITAFQMDIKISGISVEIMKAALEQAKEGRFHILGIMDKVLSSPTKEKADFMPDVQVLKVNEDKIGGIIGPGGKNVKAISEKSGARINIDDNGTITIFSANKSGADLAYGMIQGMVEEPEVGRVYKGSVKRIMDFGAFIEFLPGKEGLCHISKMSKERITSVEGVLTLDQEVDVRLIEVDRMGRYNLSITDAQESNWKPRSSGKERTR